MWDVDAMLEAMTYDQLHKWMVYSSLEPFGEIRDDQRFGILSSLIANANRNPKKRPRPYEPQDFFPSLREVSATRTRSNARVPMTAEMWKQARKSFVAHYGGK